MHQAAALPYRTSGDGRTVEVLLVTGFRSGHWIIPKGDIDDGMTPHAAAEKEACEEAGVRGRIDETSIGTFHYRKENNGDSGEVVVDVYPLEVSEELAEWPEMKDRERRWVTVADAAVAVGQPELGAILTGFSPAS